MRGSEGEKNQNARGGVRTHASEENSTLNCRLGPLGHPCLRIYKIKEIHKRKKRKNKEKEREKKEEEKETTNDKYITRRKNIGIKKI